MPDTITNSSIIQEHDAYMSLNYPRYPIAMVRGEGSELYDADGKRYLDLFAGFGAGILGHCHRDLVRVVTEQAQQLWHVGNLFHTQPQNEAAEQIFKHGFGGRSFFCHSGADANEAAIKLARLYGKKHPGKAKATPGEPGAAYGRYKIIATTGSFHGRTLGTMVATGQAKVREGFEPWLPGYMHVPYNDLPAITAAIDDETIAILVEPIQGEGGVNVPDENYLTGLRKLADERDLVLIFDEVWTGCGRTGKWFAHQHWNVSPDIMTLAKGVGGGLGVGVMCAGPRVADLYDARKHGVKHATTLGGNCLAMAVTAEIFRVIERDNLLDHATKLGQHAVDRLRAFSKKCPALKAVRGKGLFIGMDLDPTKTSSFTNANDIVNRCMEQGILINATQNTILRLAPSLTITQKQMDEGLDVIERVIAG